MIIKFSQGRRSGGNTKEYIKKHPIGIYITRPRINRFDEDPPIYKKGIYYINFRWKDKIRNIMFNFNV